MKPRIAALVFLLWSAVAVTCCADDPKAELRLTDLDSEQLPILFDFRWATRLHRYFDAKATGDKQAMDVELAAWSAEKKKATETEQSDRSQLIELLQQHELTEPALEKLFQRTKSVSWSLLLAIEQIDTRRGRPSPEFRIKLETVLLSRCEPIVDGYVAGSFSKDLASHYVCQTAARLTDDKSAAGLIQRAINAITQKDQDIDLQLLSLQTERLVKLASRDGAYRSRAVDRCQNLCQFLQGEQEYLKSFPLALAKAHYTLSALEADKSRRMENLIEALNACDKITLDSDAIPERWIWDSRRILKQPQVVNERELAELLLRYRQSKLRSSILLDGYRLLSVEPATNASALLPVDRLRFSDQHVVKSWQEFESLQQKFKVTLEEQLITHQSLAAMLRSAKDPSSSIEQDRAMSIAWLMRDRRLDEAVTKVMLECQVAWVEYRVHAAQSVPAGDATLPEVAAAIEFVSQHPKLKEIPDLATRLKRAKLFYFLSTGNLGESRTLLSELNKSDQLRVDDVLLVPSLELLLAIQTGDLRAASKLGDDVLYKVRQAPAAQQLVPYYALAELENALEFNAVSSTLRLHAVLKEQFPEAPINQSGLGRMIWLGNALQLASAVSHLQIHKSISNADPQELNKALEEVAGCLEVTSALRPRADSTGTNDQRLRVDKESAGYREVLSYLADLNSKDAELASYRIRAQIALAIDDMRIFKSKLAKQRQSLQDAQTKQYELLKSKLADNEANAVALAKNREQTAEEARQLLKKRSYTREQYNAIHANYESQAHDLGVIQAKIAHDGKELIELYDRLFRATDGVKVSADMETDLLKTIQPLRSSLALIDNSKNLSSLLYNARCLMLESAIALGPEAVGCSADQLDRYAQELTERALQLRASWNGWQQSDRGADTQASREMLFDKYQLGFELAVRWAVRRHDFRKAVQFAATTTNRSLFEFQNDFRQTESSSKPAPTLSTLELPQNFIAYYCGNESLHVFWSLGGEDIKHAESFVNRTTLDNAVTALLDKYKDHLSTGYEIEERLLSGWLLPKQLCDQLLAPKSETQPTECIYIAPHGPLFQIPLEGLPIVAVSKTELLGEVQPLIYLPSLMAMERDKAPNSDPATTDSDRVTDVREYLTIQPGQYVGSESNKLVDVLVGHHVLQLGPQECSRDAVLQALRQQPWEIVHFGAHAQKDSGEIAQLASEAEFGDLSENKSSVKEAFIDLAPDKLSTGDLKTLQLRVKHVFLSVCEAQATSVSDLKSGGNTLKTLGTTFLAIGAEDVIASHWKAISGSTTELFEQVIDGYAEQRKLSELSTEKLAALLFEARKKARAKAQHPRHWNTFTIWTTRF